MRIIVEIKGRRCKMRMASSIYTKGGSLMSICSVVWVNSWGSYRVSANVPAHYIGTDSVCVRACVCVLCVVFVRERG